MTVIPELGLSYPAEDAWPLESGPIPGGHEVSQLLPGNVGIFFVRYGPGQTLDAYLSGLATATVLADEPAAISGRTGRRVALELRRTGRATRYDGVPIEGRAVSRLTVLGLEVRGTPVLVGYQLYEDASTEFQPTLDHMLASVTIMDG